MTHRTTSQLQAGLDEIRRAPQDDGQVELIVRRPDIGRRELLEVATLDTREGLMGDNWRGRGSRHTDDGSAEPGRQITLMNARAAALVAVDPDRRALAGDQLFVDLDLGGENLPAGTRLQLGTAVIEVSPLPHTGCAKFRERFGQDAARFVHSPVGRTLNLRGINALVVQSGTVRVGDTIRKRLDA